MKFRKITCSSSALTHKIARALYSMMKNKSKYVKLGSNHDKIDSGENIKVFEKNVHLPQSF